MHIHPLHDDEIESVRSPENRILSALGEVLIQRYTDFSAAITTSQPEFTTDKAPMQNTNNPT
jgi:hypothetical protein